MSVRPYRASPVFVLKRRPRENRGSMQRTMPAWLMNEETIWNKRVFRHVDRQLLSPTGIFRLSPASGWIPSQNNTQARREKRGLEPSFAFAKNFCGLQYLPCPGGVPVRFRQSRSKNRIEQPAIPAGYEKSVFAGGIGI